MRGVTGAYRASDVGVDRHASKDLLDRMCLPFGKIVRVGLPDDVEAVPRIQRCDWIPLQIFQPRGKAQPIGLRKRRFQDLRADAHPPVGGHHVKLTKLEVSDSNIQRNCPNTLFIDHDDLPRLGAPSRTVDLSLALFVPTPTLLDVHAHRTPLRGECELEV
jgi:hypothetical protein